jgi:hypothetical protein
MATPSVPTSSPLLSSNEILPVAAKRKSDKQQPPSENGASKGGSQSEKKQKKGKLKDASNCQAKGIKVDRMTAFFDAFDAATSSSEVSSGTIYTGSRRIKLLVEYDGTSYQGWQWQRSAASIQSQLELAVFKLTGEYKVF